MFLSVVRLNATYEEADTLLVLYGVDVAKINPFQKLVVCSPDADVLLLLIFIYKSQPTRTVFRTGRGSNLRDIDIGSAFEALGEEKSAAILGFHRFTGCDQTARFYGKSKASCWKTFICSSPVVLAAFHGNSCTG